MIIMHVFVFMFCLVCQMALHSRKRSTGQCYSPISFAPMTQLWKNPKDYRALDKPDEQGTRYALSYRNKSEIACHCLPVGLMSCCCDCCVDAEENYTELLINYDCYLFVGWLMNAIFMKL